ncbi:High-affinity zinc uptake system membrane protein ZnuB [Corynebacterium capitovis DSM 44611]|uniref:metal ABC transporter permease n=1 Tax=Corynebacterium capitovis TaxID=131081 RepID=UPI00037DA702|nr:metal ABC transporter permease [Corynebacterium capitovis]WKD58132.1 High-affinity zinc uptake system membrane protein ZnuB [Corynebacterium capitovis DSM 44611]
MGALHTAVEQTAYLLTFDFVTSSLIASALLGLLSGMIAPLVVIRRMSFGVHATSELALMGAAAALLFGVSIEWGAIAGSVAAAIALALLGLRGGNDAAIGVVMSFGMGISVLCLHLYPGNSTKALALLTGQIVGVSTSGITSLAAVAVLVAATLVLLWRPLMFASLDPEMAAARGVRVRWLAAVFAVLLGLTAAQAVQVVGSLLVMSLLIAPGASAVALSANPLRAVVLSVVVAETAAVGGLLLSLAPGLPVSVTVSFISFAIYLVCWFVARARGRRIVAPNGAPKEAGSRV